MVVTAHFIDKDWVMHKRVINFKSLDSHRGEDIGRTLLPCLEECGINNVMTITVDNAILNDKAIEFLMKKLRNLYDGGKQLHVRCMAHILNLIVKDGFDEHQSSIKCMQKAVRYIRNSTQRIQRFKECMKELNVESKKFLCNDSPTRWNSTYELLKIAVELEKVFGMFSVKDPRLKFEFLQQAFEKLIKLKNTREPPIFNSEVTLKAKALIRDIEKKIENFFNFYKAKFDNTESSQSQTRAQEDVVMFDDENNFMGDLIVKSDYPLASTETELTQYQNERSVKYNKDFDILIWWKQNASFYPILDRMAKGGNVSGRK
ncbi:unnamed protein product [Lactuca saligna]|uniref:HAT C-terminal dimerisation domain-containing protein n=1 Tax=Lactuca saligna TaxID=75948 RepID=A0AA36ERI7_LACSI|nr:unnamed protein product [Lactuca saligna]